MADVLLYQAREFDLSDIEGLSPQNLAVHLRVYRQHVEEVNRLLQARAKGPQLVPIPVPVLAGQYALAPSSAPASQLAHEYNGMVLHELFFEELTGALGAVPPREGALRIAATRCFGSLEAWQSDLKQLVETRGVGWAACMRERSGNRIFNCWIGAHEVGVPAATDPLLVIDFWEHAWLPDYGPGQRAEYFQTVLAQIDWAVVERRFL